jgi:hypothetical protein
MRKYIIKEYIINCKICDKREKAASPKQKFCIEHMPQGKRILQRQMCIKRRAKLNSVFHSFSYDDWLKKIEKTDGICVGYNREPHFVGKENLSLDHIRPISKVDKGFIYNLNDVQPLCHSCNSRKSNKELT